MDTDNFSVDTALNSTSFDNESLSAHELYVYFLPSIIIWKKIFIPVWSILGIPGNILAFIVWIRPSMRASSGCVLAALAINDLIFLLLRLVIELQETWRYTMVEVDLTLT